jgi:Mor family transcriptional regulator
LRNEIGLHDEFANVWSARLVAFLRRRLGAQSIYIPAPSKADRDAAIYREFDGKNAAAIMQRHKISRSRLYQVIEEQRLLMRAGLAPQSPVSSLKTGQRAA